MLLDSLLCPITNDEIVDDGFGLYNYYYSIENMVYLDTEPAQQIHNNEVDIRDYIRENVYDDDGNIIYSRNVVK